MRKKVHIFMVIPGSLGNDSNLPSSALFSVTLYHYDLGLGYVW